MNATLSLLPLGEGDRAARCLRFIWRERHSLKVRRATQVLRRLEQMPGDAFSFVPQAAAGAGQTDVSP